MQACGQWRGEEGKQTIHWKPIQYLCSPTSAFLKLQEVDEVFQGKSFPLTLLFIKDI